jgi:hypothetical protein
MRTIKLFLWLLIIYAGLAAQAFAHTVTQSGGWSENAGELIHRYENTKYWCTDVYVMNMNTTNNQTIDNK